MLSFKEYWNLIEEGIEINPTTKTLQINKHTDAENTIVKFFPSQYFYNKNINDPYRSKNIVDSLFGCYIVLDDKPFGKSISAGNDITNLLYHTFKVGKLKHSHQKILLDPNYIKVLLYKTI